MKIIRSSVFIIFVMSFLLGFVYPMAMTGIARAVFSRKAGGSLIRIEGRVAGSELVGQNFTDPKFFHGRPSASRYDGMNSGGSNLGPTNKKFAGDAALRTGEVRKENGLPAEALVPAELVLASGSGLDPHITESSALIQAARVARVRNLPDGEVVNLVARCALPAYFGLYGEKIVNVLLINLELDGLGKKHGRGL